ncbi:hypothetical protein [Qipengyuania gelatinilytica]|uniref:DUF3617 family protein n=1 Tax=Qipengyuania gelatinilytica TaxID=2867231 RepID=A0ABX9A823_9SPHN|nr:hypothetical protein [Qipengyuania gelatinilytica]QZD95932.1 hypothetical protein K3136_04250 [Qipengyuania gelatinilytica]
MNLRLAALGLAVTSMAIAPVPAGAIPPPLPPANALDFSVDGVAIRCRLPNPGGTVESCMLQFSHYLLSIEMMTRGDGRYFYYIKRSCVEPGDGTSGHEFFLRDGILQDGETIRGSQMQIDLRETLAVRSSEKCESIANWPHEEDAMVTRLDRALAVFRSLQSAPPTN